MLILGHRGSGVTMFNRSAIGPDYPAENTVQSCRKALRAGADGIEIDVIRTADGELAVLHDDILNYHVQNADRRQRNEGYVHDHTMADLKAQSLGPGYRIATISEIFHVAGTQGKMLNVELTGRGTYKKALETARIFDAAGLLPMDRVIFSSFSLDELADLRRAAPDAKIGILFESSQMPEEPMHPESPQNYPARHFSQELTESVMDDIRPESLNLNIVDFNDDILSFARARGCEVALWSYAEKPPAEDQRTRNLISRYGREPDVTLITDYPEQARLALAPS